MFRFASIQAKIGGVLTVILVITIGISVGIVGVLSHDQLKDQQQEALAAAHDAALNQARSTFQSLELGTSGSLEQGEMEAFESLLGGLAEVPGVDEVGLTDPAGSVLYSSDPGRVDQQLAKLETTGQPPTEIREAESETSYFMARGRTYEPRCMDCHDEDQAGQVAGFLYVEYDLTGLRAEQGRQAVALAKAEKTSVLSGVISGVLGVAWAFGALFFLLRRLIVRPLKNVSHVLTEIEAGHLDARVDSDQQDELGDTARTLDALAESLETEVVTNLRKLADGDLDFAVTPRDDADLLRGSLQTLSDDLNGIMEQIKQAGETIATGSSQVAQASQSLADGASQSASSLEEISASLCEMTDRTERNAASARQANSLTGEAQTAAETGTVRMNEMVEAMGRINTSAQSISRIIQVIDDIAFQTNLLALNAAVEAARAGKHGKGFAVVAEEVRSLAARSAKAARETAALIEESVAITEQGGRIADQTAESLGHIVSGVTEVAGLIGEIALASDEQAEGISQVTIGLGQIDDVTQKNAANAQESAAASVDLSSQARDLGKMLQRFNLRRGTGQVLAPPRAPAAMQWEHETIGAP